jgi:hypothetical protein
VIGEMAADMLALLLGDLRQSGQGRAVVMQGPGESGEKIMR